MSNQILPPNTDFVPQISGTDNIGEPTLYFNAGYFNNLNVGTGTIINYWGGASLNTIPSGITINVPYWQNLIIMQNMTVYGTLNLQGISYTIY